MNADIGFLFIGGQHQFLHGAPVAAALSRRAGVRVTAYVNDADDGLALSDLLARLGAREIIIEHMAIPTWLSRAMSIFDKSEDFKVARLWWWNRRLKTHNALVCLERTTTLLKRLPGKCPPLFHIPHGAGDRAKGFEPRLALFDYLIVAGEKDRDRMVADGLVPADRIAVSGAIKPTAIRQLNPDRPRLFDNDRPVILYNPHFDQSLASWSKMAADLINYVGADGRFNLIVAPHVRLFEGKADARKAHWLALQQADQIKVDLGSERSSDMSYTRAADIYIGDVSSQIYEFLTETKPAIFLNAHHVAWQDDPNYRMWHFGEVIDRADDIVAALDRASAAHARYKPVQEKAVRYALGPVPSEVDYVPADDRAADYILDRLSAIRTADQLPSTTH